ncbi:RrF2 family transcriptional regulator [Desulfonatronum parangueonense]
MKLSARSRYAARILLDLAEQKGNSPVCASSISENTEISVPFIEQILRPLKKAGYIQSVRGAYGGHVLLMDPATITLGDIVRTMGGDINLAQCGSDPTICTRTSDCRTRIVWQHLSKVIERELDNMTLADLMQDPETLQEKFSTR